MMTKEQILNLSGVLATASITAVGFAIGGEIGAAIMGGIGINLSSNIIQNGAINLKEKWLGSANGILNHDIQQALARAFIKSLNSLEKKYFALEETNELPKEKSEAIKSLFRELKDEAQTVFLPSIEKAVNEQEIKSYLYGSPQDAKNALWGRIDEIKLIYTYYGEHFKNFLRDNSLNEVVFWFGEELKTDNKENNKAWRAFQRMILEGIQADVKAVKASQDVVKHDLKKLDKIRKQLTEIKDTIDHRLPNEPFQESFANALTDIKSALQDVANATQRIEGKQDIHLETTNVIARDIKKLLAEKTKTEFPPIPDDVKTLFEQGLSLRNLGKYKESKKVFQEALSLATGYKDKRAIAAAKRYQAIILKEFDRDHIAAKVLFDECLREFRELKDEKHLAMTLYDLGVNEIEDGNLDQAGAYLSQALELDKKNNEKRGTAATLQQLGRIESERGHSQKAIELEDEALKYYLGIYQDSETEKDNDLLLWIAGCYQNKGLIYETLGMVGEVEANYLRSLEWHRKAGYKLDLGKLLFLLARLKYREAQYDDGTIFLDEAIEIYTEIDSPHLLIRCLDMRGRVFYTLGQTDQAISIFESTLDIAKEAEDYEEQAIYLAKLGQIYLKDKKQPDRAKKYFEEERNITLREGLLKGYAEAVEDLAQVAHIEKNFEERDRLLAEGIKALEKVLLQIEAEPKKASITGQIGLFWERMQNFPQALVYYQRAKKAYESFADIGGIANSLGSIGRVKGFLGKKNEEFDAYRELKTLVDGTPYYDMIAGTAINLGEINMQIGNLDEAKMLFQEAYFLQRKYNLHFAEHIRNSLNRLNELINFRKSPELSFEELVKELFDLVDWFPEAKDNLLRLWFSGRIETLFGNFRTSLGIKFMLCQDNVEAFTGIAEILSPYSDICLQVVSSKYPGTGLNIVPFPMDKKMFFDKRYQPTSDVAESTITGNGGGVLVGWDLGLPDQAHKLILSSSAIELIKHKIFFLPYERNLSNDKLLNDISFFGQELGLIPVYFDALPVSENITVLHSAKMSLPILSSHDVESQRRQIRKVKHALIEMLSVTKDSAQSALNNFVFEVDELSDICKKGTSIQIQIYILEFLNVLEKALHVAIVVKDY